MDENGCLYKNNKNTLFVQIKALVITNVI